MKVKVKKCKKTPAPLKMEQVLIKAVASSSPNLYSANQKAIKKNEPSAADIVCYGSDGNIISAKIVTCAAQDIGFPGIANINKKYTAVHVDVRDSNTYRGDEVKGTRSVTDDFYNYWNLTRSDVYGVAYTEHTVRKGESLWAIAQKYLGSGRRYKEIKSLNSLKSDIIYVGQVLKIPLK